MNVLSIYRYVGIPEVCAALNCQQRPVHARYKQLLKELPQLHQEFTYQQYHTRKSERENYEQYQADREQLGIESSSDSGDQFAAFLSLERAKEF